MAIYIIIYIILFVFSLLEQIDVKEEKSGILTKQTIFYFALVILVGFSGLRYQVGPDYSSYKMLYETTPTKFLIRSEFGFHFLLTFFNHYLGCRYETFLFLFSFSSVFIKGLFFKKYFKNPIFLLMLYFPFIFFLVDFGQIRQGMALGIALWCIPAVKEKKFIKYYLLWFLAASIHNSALILFPFYFLGQIRLTIKVFLIMFFIGFLANLIDVSYYIFSLIETVLKGTIIGSVMTYLKNYGGVERNLLVYYFLQPGTTINIFVTIVFLLINKKNDRKTMYDIICNMNMFMVLIVKFFTDFMIFQQRGSYYYKLYEIFLIYYIFKKIKEKEWKLTLIFILFLYGIMRINMEYSRFSIMYNNYTMNYPFLGF